MAAPPRSKGGTTTISNFPFLTLEEFEGACRAFLDRIRAVDSFQPAWSSVRFQATGPLLKISQTIDGFSHPPRNKTPKESFSIEESQREICEDDPEALMRTSDLCDSLQVDYDILLSAAYQVPVLYFTLRQTSHPKPLGIDDVYRYLVPNQYKKEIQSVGIMGGISFGYHPETGTPAFFVHPCNTAEAMRHIVERHEIIPETYLIIWLGLVGNCVRLHLPSEFFTMEDIQQFERCEIAGN